MHAARRLVIPAAVATVLASGACTPEPANTPAVPALTSGTYVQTGESVDPASCGRSSTPYFGQFATVEIAVVERMIVASFGEAELAFQTTYEVEGTSLRDPREPGHAIVDLNDPVVAVTSEGFATTFDCVLDVGIEFAGVITSDDRFALHDVFSIGVVSGEDCGIVQQSSGIGALPCEDSANTSWAL